MKPPVFRTKRFFLRPFRRSDAESLARNINNPQISKMTGAIPNPYTIKDAEDYLRETLKHYREKLPKTIKIAVDIGGEVVGGIGLHKISWEHKKAEIGYWLSERYWGRGIMTEVLAIVTRYGFQELRFKRLEARVFTINIASRKVLEKCGYQLEGLLRKNFKKRKRSVDTWILARVKD